MASILMPFALMNYVILSIINFSKIEIFLRYILKKISLTIFLN